LTETILLPPVSDDSAFVDGEERTSFHVLPIPLPSVWAEENFYLTEGAGYSSTGRIVLYPWERDPLNAIYHYDRVILCGPVQTGKSLIARCAAG